MKVSKKDFLIIFPVFCLIILFSAGRIIESADHGDGPRLIAIPRHDARITDLFAFRDGSDLVIALCADPTIPVGVSQYTFQDDVTFEIHIDNSTHVNYQDQTANQTYGGTVIRPDKIKPDVSFEITFNSSGPKLKARGLSGNARDVSLFTGLRDDPFIRGPRIGRNVAAMVLKIPLYMVARHQSEMLIWADSRVPEINNTQGDLAGRALRSMFPENEGLNYVPPSRHTQLFGVPPDVIIYDISRPAVYPNGRGLTDDVVDLVGDSRILGNDSPFPAENDVPFLTEFPYLAPPQ